MVHVSSLSFLSPGNFPDDDPHAGLENTLRLYEYGEGLGFDGAWIRQRHLEHGVSSAATFLAAASQRTSRVELGTAVIPIGYESPFRLAEDLPTADVLSRGRLQAGVSQGHSPARRAHGRPGLRRGLAGPRLLLRPDRTAHHLPPQRVPGR